MVAPVRASSSLQRALGEHYFHRPSPIQLDIVQAFEEILKEHSGKKPIETEPEEGETSSAPIDIEDIKKQKAKAEEPGVTAASTSKVVFSHLISSRRKRKPW